jgi:hypothetical protein
LGCRREKGAACLFAARSASSNNPRRRSFSFLSVSISRSSRAIFSAPFSSATAQANRFLALRNQILFGSTITLNKYNRKLKHVKAELTLDNRALQDVISKNF